MKYGYTISDIVEKAGVAKGTFYLYFKDKYAIIKTNMGDLCLTFLIMI